MHHNNPFYELCFTQRFFHCLPHCLFHCRECETLVWEFGIKFRDKVYKNSELIKIKYSRSQKQKQKTESVRQRQAGRLWFILYFISLTLLQLKKQVFRTLEPIHNISFDNSLIVHLCMDHKQNIIVNCFEVLRFSIESWSHSCCIPTCSRRWTDPAQRPVLSCPHFEEPPGLHLKPESEQSGWNQQPLKQRQEFGLSMLGTFLDPDPSWAERWDLFSTDQTSPLQDRNWQEKFFKAWI